MRLPEFTAEASLYRMSGSYHAMRAAGGAGGREVRPQALSFPLSFCWGDVFGPFCCICDASSICSCVRPFRRSLPTILDRHDGEPGGVGHIGGAG
jgi:hypothetical protein